WRRSRYYVLRPECDWAQRRSFLQIDWAWTRGWGLVQTDHVGQDSGDSIFHDTESDWRDEPVSDDGLRDIQAGRSELADHGEFDEYVFAGRRSGFVLVHSVGHRRDPNSRRAKMERRGDGSWPRWTIRQNRAVDDSVRPGAAVPTGSVRIPAARDLP